MRITTVIEGAGVSVEAKHSGSNMLDSGHDLAISARAGTKPEAVDKARKQIDRAIADLERMKVDLDKA